MTYALCVDNEHLRGDCQPWLGWMRAVLQPNDLFYVLVYNGPVIVTCYQLLVPSGLVTSAGPQGKALEYVLPKLPCLQVFGKASRPGVVAPLESYEGLLRTLVAARLTEAL